MCQDKEVSGKLHVLFPGYKYTLYDIHAEILDNKMKYNETTAM